MRRSSLRCFVIAVVATLASVSVSAGDVTVTMQGGLVTIIARDVSVQQILQEWARIGNVRILNTEVLSQDPVTLQLVNVPESQALDTLLRSTAGYVAAPRAADVTGSSLYDRIVILPTSRVGAMAGAPVTAAPVPQRPESAIEDADDDRVDAGFPGLPPLRLPRMPDPGDPAAAASDGNSPSDISHNPGPVGNGGSEPVISGPVGMPTLILPAAPGQQPGDLAPNVPAITPAPWLDLPLTSQRPPGGKN
jgi:hypothetical protein